MIDHIFLDIDGVIVGTKTGINFPFPSKEVLQTLKHVNKKVPISLISAKPLYAFEEIINASKLDSYHSGDNGAVIANVINSDVKKVYSLDSILVKEIIETGSKNKIYTEIYTKDSYTIESNNISSITNVTTNIRGVAPNIVEDMNVYSHDKKIIKAIFIFENKNNLLINELVSYFEGKVSIKKSYHPTSPYVFLVITRLGVSKKNAISEIAKICNIDSKKSLAVGDSPQDWDFIEECKYKATLENAKEELKQEINRANNSYISPSVDKDGIIDIFSHYNLL